MRPDDPAYAGEKPGKGERVLHGLGVSPGIAIGPAFISDDGDVAVPDYRVADDQIEAERDRFAAALAAALKQLRKLKGKSTTLPDSAAEEMGYLLDAHIAMLTNSRLVRGVERRISEDRVNAERAVQMEIAQISESFAEMGDAYLAARVEDIRVVGARLIRNLTKTPYAALQHVAEGTVILAEELTPADPGLMDPQRIAGFAAVLGGPESHTAIMARALGLPAVLGVAGLLGHIDPGDTGGVDGTAGNVVISPDGKTVARYEEEREALQREQRHLAPLKRLPAGARADREILLQAHLQRRGAKIADPLPPLGVMIEIPGAALAADALAAEADFFAIGTNDLIQYTLAIDRGDEQVAHLYNPLHPAVLRLIQFAVEAALRARIPVSLCGEMAGDPRFTPLLLGLGIRDLSMAPSKIGRVKQRIRSLDMAAATRRARAIMDQLDDARIASLLDDFNALA